MGIICDLDKLLRLAKNKKITVLEDAAQNIGAKYRNKYLGTFGDFGGFSFMAIK